MFSVIFISLPFLFYSDFQDCISTVSYYNPELILGIRDFITLYWFSLTVNSNPASSFDVYQDVLVSSQSEFIEYLSAFCPFIFLVTALVSLTRIASIGSPSDAYLTRAYIYLYSITTELRLQFEASIQVFFFSFVYISMMTATFDDDQEELLEFFFSSCFYFFLLTLIYYFYKYSIHYFTFLESSKTGISSSNLVVQFLFDALNIIAFCLRFLVLIARLNIYDGVDDILDSYYIFVADFEEEEYFSDTFFSFFSVMSFDIDVNDDRSFLFEDEMDLSTDVFLLYFLV